MKFIVDAQIPRTICALLTKHGHDAIHTIDLPSGNATKDGIINPRSAVMSFVWPKQD